MIPLFLGLTLANFAGLITTAILGYLTVNQVAKGDWHILIGSLATMLCVAVHCIVITYFIATAKWIQHAIAVKQLDPALAAPTRSFKAQAFPFALLAIFASLITAFMGAAVSSYNLSRNIHHAAALTLLAINLISAIAEYGAIKKNGDLIDRILVLANVQHPQAPAGTNPRTPTGAAKP